MNLNDGLNDEQLESALRMSLRRESAPPDFAARVLAKTRRPKSRMQRPFSLALAAALTGVAIVPAVVLDYRHRQGLKAKQDLLTALSITRDRFQHARDQVRRNARKIQ